MNGIHDCGGIDGLGPIEIEADEPVFHAPWEARVFGLNWAIGANGFWSLDEYRFAMEDRPVVDYMRDSYYAKWVYGLERLLVEKGVVRPGEFTDARHADLPAAAEPKPALKPDMVAPLVRNGVSAKRDTGKPCRFAAGDRVRARNINIAGHTRVPRYIRGKNGVVQFLHGFFTFNDSVANEGLEKPQMVYSVRFAATDLWGDDANPHDSLCIDLWDDHLEALA
ncbi:nitrile hydratase subunit beta [Pseudaminobacter salicylatoxidans]|uniref:Nitrile hydratase subunit beta n=1 Tax=Pseudaminobacter salicylatoxidans TaxID=93369 RepID=A0A7G6KSY4_PSESE|nr:nitrile hydratase subunit beta [Pseudaminobacter salicylatoxidans]QNC71621.1 nitrile hydratase subunit beta [Pseudaminobacter salicylatoxidans]